MCKEINQTKAAKVTAQDLQKCGKFRLVRNLCTAGSPLFSLKLKENGDPQFAPKPEINHLFLPSSLTEATLETLETFLSFLLICSHLQEGDPQLGQREEHFVV